MPKIFISGLTNIESSLKVDSFPIEYNPIEYPFFGISTSVSGVGYNITKALTVLKEDIDLFSIVGSDINGASIMESLARERINTNHLQIIKNGKSAESIVLVDKDGKRKIYCDLKDLQEINIIPNINPLDYDLAILTNINFSRPLLKVFKNNNVPIASDVHVLSNLDDEYNRDFLNNSSILFLSNEGCLGKEESFIKEIYNHFHNDIIVIGCGEKGAIAYVGKEDRYYHQKAVAPLGINNTVGAGDALFSSFIHYYLNTGNIEKSLQFATIFAGLKISSSGGGNGFYPEEEVNKYL